jgi:very-short-patch-repair endonuclease
MSYPEVLLWQRLRRKATGLKVRKQHPIGPYIVDFCCASERFVVEVDGQIHAQPGQIVHDESRDRFLVENGYRVVRINAAEILKDADSVAASIGLLAARPLHHPSDGPPPRSGEDQE